MEGRAHGTSARSLRSHLLTVATSVNEPPGEHRTHNADALASSIAALMTVVLTLTAFSQSQTFGSTGSLNTGRNGHRAILLNTGMVLFAGGYDVNENALASSELYDPTTGIFLPSGNLNTPRRNFGITLLENGTVLLTGGYDSNFNALASAEIYDPATGAFTLTGSLGTARADPTATRLLDGTVLIAGGFDSAGNSISSAEIYNPSTGAFVPTGSLNNARGFATATCLLDGRVLVAGGWAAGSALPSAEIYYNATGVFSPTGSMHVARVRNTATLLNGGKVLIVGGEDSASTIQSTAELYDPTSGSFTPTGSLNTARGDHAATLLTNGTVLVEGGFACDPTNCLLTDVDMSASAEIYDPATGTFSNTSSLATARQVQTSTLLTNGKVLVAGGWSDTNPGLTSAEIYAPENLTPANLSSISVSPPAPILTSGGGQPLFAIGTFVDQSTETLASVIWNSSDHAVATVSNTSGSNSSLSNDSNLSGVVFGTGPGTATVSACAGLVCGSTTVNVSGPGQGFALSASPASRTVSAGDTAVFSLALTPEAGFSAPVALSCNGNPPGTQCSITPSVLSPGDTTATATISTTGLPNAPYPAGTYMEPPYLGHKLRPILPITALAAIAVFPICMEIFQFEKRRNNAIKALLAVLLGSQLIACGTDPARKELTATPQGSYVITITGRAGTMSHTAKFALIVR